MTLSSAKKRRAGYFVDASGSRRNFFQPIVVVRTSQDRLGQNSIVTRNPVGGESLHRADCGRFWYSRPQAGVWAALLIMSYPLFENCPQVSLVQGNQEMQTIQADRSD